MKNFRLLSMSLLIAYSMISCDSGKQKDGNPLLSEFSTPHKTPPFDQIKREHFIPAIDSALSLAKADFENILADKSLPTFNNTIEALDNVGEKLATISGILYNLNYAETDSTLQKIVREVAPKLTDFNNDIKLNEILFQRVKTVWDEKDSYSLNPEQETLLEKTYKGFVRNGANLDEKSKERYREVTRELSELSLQFNENVLAETNAYVLHLTSEQELAGLPKSLVDAAAFTAKQKGKEGWVITLDYPMYGPFMKYSEKRDLREKLYKAYNCRGFQKNEFNNTELIKRLVNLRLEMANLLGYKNFSDFVLEERMAKSAENVNSFLNELLNASLPVANDELKEVSQFAKGLGVNHSIEKWDWSYYTEKLKNNRYNFNEEELKPYFKLENVEKGVFDLATKLYGVKFKPNKSIPVYHPDVKTYEVIDADGSFLAVLYLDFFPREGKSGGAWMTSYNNQFIKDGENIRPHISIVTNFTKPTEDTPSLLTFDEVTTFLHEFGHALHGIFANTTYQSLSGTSVYRDFVELPSQIMENWAIEKEFLDMFAVHYQTGEKIPQNLIQSIIDSKNYLAGNLSIRQLSFGIIDMAWHSIDKPFDENVADFEIQTISKTDILPSVKGTVISTAFSHIFSGGYSAGYYSYKWAEVLDADAYSLFKQNGIFDTKTAKSFRENILSKGGSEHPMALYTRFRGQEPSIDALLERSGLKK